MPLYLENIGRSTPRMFSRTVGEYEPRSHALPCKTIQSYGLANQKLCFIQMPLIQERKSGDHDQECSQERLVNTNPVKQYNCMV